MSIAAAEGYVLIRDALNRIAARAEQTLVGRALARHVGLHPEGTRTPTGKPDLQRVRILCRVGAPTSSSAMQFKRADGDVGAPGYSQTLHKWLHTYVQTLVGRALARHVGLHPEGTRTPTGKPDLQRVRSLCRVGAPTSSSAMQFKRADEDVSAPGYSPRNLLPRHSGEGRNPGSQITPRSGQSHIGYRPTAWGFSNWLDSGLRRNDENRGCVK